MDVCLFKFSHASAKNRGSPFVTHHFPSRSLERGEKEGCLRMKKQMDRFKVSAFVNFPLCDISHVFVYFGQKKLSGLNFDPNTICPPFQVQMSQSLNRTEKSVALSTELLKLGE